MTLSLALSCVGLNFLWKNFGEDFFHFPCVEPDTLVAVLRRIQIECLLIAEKNDELLLENHDMGLVGSKALPEANASTAKRKWPN